MFTVKIVNEFIHSPIRSRIKQEGLENIYKQKKQNCAKVSLICETFVLFTESFFHSPTMLKMFLCGIILF